MSSDSDFCVYEELRADLLEEQQDAENNAACNPVWKPVFEILDRALRIVLEQQCQQQHGAKKKKTDVEELTNQLFTLVEKAGRLPVEYPEHVAHCLLLARQGAVLDDVSVDQLMHRSILDVICRCGLTCHLMVLMVDGQITADQLFSVNPLKKGSGVNESPFTYAVISNHTNMVFLITTFSSFDDYEDDDEPINSATSLSTERLRAALRAKGMSDRVQLHYCAINRNKKLFKFFVAHCPDTLFYFDKSGYTPPLYMTTAWSEAATLLEEIIDPEGGDSPHPGRHKIAIDLMNALPSGSADAVSDDDPVSDGITATANDATHSVSALSASSVHSPPSNSQQNGNLPAKVKREDIVADFAEEERRYKSCTRPNLKTGRDLINWAAQDAEVPMLCLLLETFATVTNTSACPNSIYFQHLLRYDPYAGEPILAAFTAGAEVNFLQLLSEASSDLFCEIELARRPPTNTNETIAQLVAENERLSTVEVVEKYFLDKTKSGLASGLMESIVLNTVYNAQHSPRNEETDSQQQIQLRFVKAKTAMRKFLNNDIACRQERAVLPYDFTDRHSAQLTRKIRDSFTYLQQITLSPDAKQKLFGADAAETILLPKMRCDCEFFELPCSTELSTLHVDWPPLTKGCPCLGPLAQYKDNDPTTALNINEKAAMWTVIPDINTFPRMAGYYWKKRTELHEERQGPLVFDLRVVPRSDDGTGMAFIFACSDECRCDESNCPTSTVFGLSRCFFSVADYQQNRLGLQRYGLATREKIAEGQFIGKLVGHLCTRRDVDELEGEAVHDEYSTARWQYVKRLPLPFGRAVMREMAESRLEAFDFYVDQYAYGNFTRFIRHACGANANVSVHLMLPRGTVDMRQRVMVLFANRHIDINEELTMDFGDWFLSRTDPNAVCGCSETGCRKPMPPSTQ